MRERPKASALRGRTRPPECDAGFPVVHITNLSGLLRKHLRRKSGG